MHSWSELIGPLDFSQAAPPCFLWLEKFFVQVLGDSDFVLRIVPFCAGIGSLFLFLLLARQVLSKNAVPIAVSLFAVSEPLVRYATEFKQYSTDVFFTLLFLYLLTRLEGVSLRTVSVLSIVMLAVVGPWFSYPMMFVILSCVLAGFYLAGKHSSKKHAVFWLMLSVGFAFSALVLCKVSLSLLAAGASRDALMDVRSVPPHSFAAFSWFYHKISEILFFPGGFAQLGIGPAALCFSIGFCQLRGRQALFVCAVMLAALSVLISSWFSIYPLYGRFLLFFTPLFLLFVAEGAIWLYELVGARAPGLAKILLLLLFWPRFEFFLCNGEQAWLRHTDVRGALRYVQSNRVKGDLIYLYYGAYFPARYYCRSSGLREEDLIVGAPGYWWNSNLRESLMKARGSSSLLNSAISGEVAEAYRSDNFSPQWQVFEDDVRRLVGHDRVWVLFSLSNWLGSNEEKVFLYFLDKYGVRLTCFKTSGASIYLYNMGVGSKTVESRSP